MTKFIGDVHGMLEYIPRDRDQLHIQLGDLGVGFVDVPEMHNFKFIRGNHDNPELCRKHPNYIGDWWLEGTVLFLSGAGSIDKIMRIPNVDWWPDEELTSYQMREVLSLESQVTAVVAHDVPLCVYKSALGINEELYRFNTPLFLDEVLKKFKPTIWVAGHHHKDIFARVENCNFHILGVGRVKEIGVGLP